MCGINQRLKNLQSKESTMKFLMRVNDAFSQVRTQILSLRLTLYSSKKKCKGLWPTLWELNQLFWLPKVQAIISKGKRDLYVLIVAKWVILWTNATSYMVFHQDSSSRTTKMPLLIRFLLILSQIKAISPMEFLILPQSCILLKLMISTSNSWLWLVLVLLHNPQQVRHLM